MKVFTVISMDDFSRRLSLEPYSSFSLALMRAVWITRHAYKLVPNENPEAQKTGYSTDVEYVVFQDNESVLVSILEQDMRDVLPHFRGDFSFTIGGNLGGSPEPQTVVAIASPPPLVDNAMDPTLPAGWTYDGKPIRMDVLLSDAENVKCVNSLTIDQQFALAIARVSKRPNFSYVTDIGVLIQSSALSELKNRTSYGYQVMESEMDFINDVYETNLIIDIFRDN